MKERFEGGNRPALVHSLSRQFGGGNATLAERIAGLGELLEFSSGDRLIVEGASDNDVYFIVSGTVSVVVKGREVRTLGAGDHVGEMSAIEPSLNRAATVVAAGTVVAVKLTSSAFVALADEFSSVVWRSLSQELSRRLHDRNRLMTAPNEKPRLFIMSSIEGLPVAREIQSQLTHDALATVWTDGVFWAGGYPLEALEESVNDSDFGIAVAMFEDIVESRGESNPSIRDNVLFELGMFMGKLGRRRSILVYPSQKGLKLPSDLHGLTPASYIPGDAKDLSSRIAPVGNQIRKIIADFGVRVIS